MATQTRPFIGVNADFVAAGKQTSPHVRLHAGYLDAVVAAGGFPVVLPPLGKEVPTDALLDRLDGFVLTGGADLDPRRHGLPWHPAVQLMPERRDDSDRALVRKLLERSGLKIGDVDVIELNEAFAAQALAVTRELGLPDDAQHVNANGGAIALGHPLGASGARITLTAVRQLHAVGGRYAVATMCIGVGQGIALLVERV